MLLQRLFCIRSSESERTLEGKEEGGGWGSGVVFIRIEVLLIECLYLFEVIDWKGIGSHVLHMGLSQDYQP